MNPAAWILATLLPAAAAGAGPRVVTLEPVAPPVAGQYAQLPAALFGGTNQDFEWSVGNIDMKNATVRVDIFEVAGRLTVPLPSPAPLAGIDLPGLVRTTLSFPKVKAETDVLLRLSATNSARPSPVLLGNLRYVVFPNDLARQISGLLPPLPNGGHRLVVFGTGTRLREGLQALQVPFTDSGADLPGRLLPDQIYVGEAMDRPAAERIRDHASGARVAVFAMDDSLPRGVYLNRSPDRTYGLVTLPVLDALASDPRAQLVFLKVLQSLLPP